MSNNIVSPKLNSSSNIFKINSVSVQSNYIDPNLLNTNITNTSNEFGYSNDIDPNEILKEYTMEELGEYNYGYEPPLDELEEPYEGDIEEPFYEPEYEPEFIDPEDWDNDGYWWGYDNLTQEPKVPNTFAELTDKDYNDKIAYISSLINWDVDYRDEEIKKTAEKMGFEVVEFVDSPIRDKYGNTIYGEDGFKAVVLKDEYGNYTIIYPSTDDNDFRTMLYDIYPMLVETGLFDLIIDNDYKLEKCYDIMKSIFLIMYGEKINDSDFDMFWQNFIVGCDDCVDLLNKIEGIYKSHNNQAYELSRKYCSEAALNDTQLNFFGYSKGGSLAEYSYGCFKLLESYSDRDIIGKCVVYNPLHCNTLSKEEVEVIKNSGDDFVVYRQQGDYVSTLFHENTYDEQTVAIYCDWKTIAKKEGFVGQKPLDSWLVDWIDLELLEVLTNSRNIKYLLSGGAHQPQNSRNYAYDENGNALKYDPKTGKRIELPSYEDISQFFFHTSDPLVVLEKDAHVIVRFADSLNSFFEFID